MYEGPPRLQRDNHRASRAHLAPDDRPARAALWAFVLGLCLTVWAVATADASSGGIGQDPPPPEANPAETSFGSRVLRVGMEGTDVRVLNGIVTSKAYARRVSVTDVFTGPTGAGVRGFQRRKGLAVSGVVNEKTAKALTRSMPLAAATWYGPGFYGNNTACGRVLRRGTIGVAHRSLPCGTKVTFAYRGRHLVVPVIDRGPYSGGYTFDLTSGAAKALGFASSDKIRYAVAR